MAGQAEDRATVGTLAGVMSRVDLKWIFVGGKGGVGKTTCSCALAIQLCKRRETVLIVSTDPAHNLSDAFRQKFTRSPTLVEGYDNLYAMEVDPNPDINSDVLLDGQGLPFLSEFASSIPGIDEAMGFAEVMKMVQSMDYSCVVFDTAPTGHTLRLLQFPTTLEEGLSKVLGLQGTFGGILGQMSTLLGMSGSEEGHPVDQLFGKLRQLKTVVETVNRQFRRADLTTFICVCIPEFLSLYETERLVQELAKFEIDVHNIVINHIIFPKDAEGSQLLQARVKLQQKYLDQFGELYSDMNIVKLPLMEDEVRGIAKIEEFSQHLVASYQQDG